LVKRNIPASEMKKIQEDEDFWYANQIFKKDKEKNNEEEDAEVLMVRGGLG
jgi:hypothetical protein